MNTKVLLGLVLLVVLVAGFFAFSFTSNDSEEFTNNVNQNLPSEQAIAESQDPIYQTNEEETDLTGDEEPEEAAQEENSGEVEVESVSSVEVREEEVVENVNDTITEGLEYANGVYQTNTSYALPNGGSHQMDVEITLAEDVITDVKVVFDGDVSGGSTAIQKRFIDAMSPEVIGNKVNAVSLSRTGGASLTTGGFNEALENIKTQALN